jgi:hypothetical protein
MNLFQKGVLSRKHAGRRIILKNGTKQLIPSARQRTCPSVVGVQNVPCQTQCIVFGAFGILPGLVPERHFPSSAQKKNLKVQRFPKTEEVTADTTIALKNSLKWFPETLPTALWTF